MSKVPEEMFAVISEVPDDPGKWFAVMFGSVFQTEIEMRDSLDDMRRLRPREKYLPAKIMVMKDDNGRRKKR